MTGSWMDSLWMSPYRFSLCCMALAFLLALARRRRGENGSPEGVFRSYLGALDPESSVRRCVAWVPHAPGITTSAEGEDPAEEEILDAQIAEA